MKLHFAFLLSTCAALAAVKPADDVVQKEKQRLQGDWIVLRTTSGPCLQDVGERIINFTFRRDGANSIKEREVELGTYTLDPSQMPRAMDVKYTAGPNKGMVARWIYSIEGDRLALGIPGDGAKRPERLDSANAFVFKRHNADAERKALETGEEPPDDLRLPLAMTARHADPKQKDLIYLNLTVKAEVMLHGKEKPLPALPDFLKKAYERREAAAGKAKVRTAIVVRGDRDVDYGPVHSVVGACREQGFPQLFLSVRRLKPDNEVDAKLVPKDLVPADLFNPLETQLELAVDDGKSELTVIARTIRDGLNDGVLESVSVKDKARTIGFANLDRLRDHLVKVRKDLVNKDAIRIQPDTGLKYAYVIEVMDTRLKAGFTRVSFAISPEAPKDNDDEQSTEAAEAALERP